MLAALSNAAVAAGLDCGRAASPTESTICSTADLQRQDAQLAIIFGRLMRAAPTQSDATRAEQLRWLKTRDQCDADRGCLSQRYSDRIGALQKQLHMAIAYVPDAVDQQALEDLKRAVDEKLKTEPEYPLDRALDQFSLKGGVTSFDGETDDDGRSVSLPGKRPPGVTEDEWRAIKASGPLAEDTAIDVNCTLLNVEGETHRVLVATLLDGGNGVYSFSTAWVRRGDRYVRVFSERTGGRALDKEETMDGLLLSFNGKGANQTARWVRLRNRVYVAYIDGEFGADNVYLVRPLTIVDKAPKLIVRYRYSLSVPRTQKREDPPKTVVLDSQLHLALSAAVKPFSVPVWSNGLTTAEASGEARKPLCPIPAGVRGDERDEFYSWGAGGYTEEVVGDTSVWIRGKCYLARIVDWFGHYSPGTGLNARISIRQPIGDDPEQSFDVQGKRVATRTEASFGKVMDNGDGD